MATVFYPAQECYHVKWPILITLEVKAVLLSKAGGDDKGN